jgi:hypothetical protein
MIYLAYDIKGIQQFIFSVPKLKYIVGASLLIAEFDEDFKKENGVIFTGGGRGVFHTDSPEALKSELIKKAHEYGLDLRIGIAEKFSDAVKGADELYTFIPDSFDGEPDKVSGMFPTTDKNREHPIVEKRRQAAHTRKAESLDNRILSHIRKDLADGIKNFEGQIEFLSSVEADDADGNLGSEVIGDRNRWAIVCLDGNDMGAQFRVYEEQHKDVSEKEKTEWYKKMSNALTACTQGAFYKALTKILNDWWYEEGVYLILSQDELLVLPFRPLVLGGDDVTAIVHCSYAMDFAKTLIAEFNRLSKEHGHLWEGTNGELTISAGIAYTNTSLPLHTSIPYTESLLASAKGKFRKDKKEGEATPAAIDWENVTESMLDTPTARRERDLVFCDEDMETKTKITLTERPYKIADLEKLETEVVAKLKSVPRSILADAQMILTLPWAQRIQRLAAMKKMNSDIAELIQFDDFDDKHKPERHVRFIDAVSLLEENHRLTQSTTNND